MTMTRQEAEAAGWEFSLPFHVEYTFASKGTKDETTIFRNSESEILEAITAIERHADAERMLEKAKALIRDLEDESRYPNGETAKEARSFLAKLEARK